MKKQPSTRNLKKLLCEVKVLAAKYYKETNKPLGVTGEVAEYEASVKLGLTLAPPRTPAYDAYSRIGRRRKRFQIKGRAVSLDDRYRGRVPRIAIKKGFDAVLLVLLDKTNYEAIEIWQASRAKVVKRLEKRGSKSRNLRGSMGIRQFKSIAGKQPIWQSPG